MLFFVGFKTLQTFDLIKLNNYSLTLCNIYLSNRCDIKARAEICKVLISHFDLLAILCRAEIHHAFLSRLSLEKKTKIGPP